LDNNHPTNAINKTIDTINKYSQGQKDVRVLKVAMVPEMVTTMQDYPFSMSFLV